MKKTFSIIALSILSLTGCQSTKGTVTPTEAGYYVDAVGNSKSEARQNALDTAKAYCDKYNQRFYVISETNERTNEVTQINDTTTDTLNTASKLLLGGNLLDTTNDNRMHFNCR